MILRWYSRHFMTILSASNLQALKSWRGIITKTRVPSNCWTPQIASWSSFRRRWSCCRWMKMTLDMMCSKWYMICCLTISSCVSNKTSSAHGFSVKVSLILTRQLQGTLGRIRRRLCKMQKYLQINWRKRDYRMLKSMLPDRTRLEERQEGKEG